MSQELTEAKLEQITRLVEAMTDLDKHIKGTPHRLMYLQVYVDELRRLIGRELTAQAVNEYQLDGGEPDSHYSITLKRRIQREGSSKWGVYDIVGNVLAKNTLTFEYEPLPSARTEEFLERCRFDTPEEAVEVFHEYLRKEHDNKPGR